MGTRRTVFAALFLAFVSAACPAQVVGDLVPPTVLTGWTGTKARNLTDLAGRVVLLEFFFYW